MDDSEPTPLPVAVVVVHAPSEKLLKRFTLYDHPNSSTDSSASSTTAGPGPGPSKHARDAGRRRHVLDELVDSEQVYLADLHTLPDVYLAQLPALLPSLDAPLVARNTADLLAFHTDFTARLAAAGRCADGRVDGAIQAVAQAFVDAISAGTPSETRSRRRLPAQASGFSISDAFCHGHLAATEAIRRFESRVEYSIFERTCAALASPATPPHLQHAAAAPLERTPSPVPLARNISALLVISAHLARN